MTNLNQNNNDSNFSRPLSKKALIWIVCILVVLFILILISLSSFRNAPSQPSTSLPSTMSSTADQLSQIDALRNQLTPAASTTGTAPINTAPANATKTITKQVQTLNSLNQKAAPHTAPSAAQIQQQLDQLNALRSK